MNGRDADGNGGWLTRLPQGVYDPDTLQPSAKKNRSGTTRLTVLKPTQVGGMSILRRSREPS